MPTLKLIPNRCDVPVVILRIANINYHFLIDTGATRTIVRSQFLTAETPTQSSYHRTHNGIIRSIIAKHQFRFAGVLLHTVDVFDLDYLNELLPTPVGGIIGQDILRQFASVVFDYKRQTVTFSV